MFHLEICVRFVILILTVTACMKQKNEHVLTNQNAVNAHILQCIYGYKDTADNDYKPF